MYCIGVILLLVITSVQGRPEGAPLEACGETTDIVPNHGSNTPSDTPLPYSVDLSDFTDGEYIPGDTYLSKEYLFMTILNFSHVAS